MAVFRVKLSPDIDELARVRVAPWWVQNLGKRRCLGFCVASGFVPVWLRIAKVYASCEWCGKPCEKRTNRWPSERR